MEWLEENAPGFTELGGHEREAITQFLFLCSLFEARVLNASANANTIREAAERWLERCNLTEETFGLQINYFRNRYVSSKYI